MAEDSGDNFWAQVAVNAASAQQANLQAGRVRQGTMDFQAWSLGKQQEFANALDVRHLSTAHQHQVADMRAAGLNPILSATGGKGATGGVSGAGAGLPGATYQPQRMESGVAASSAVALKRNRSEIENIDEDTTLKRDQQELARQQRLSAVATAEEAVSRTNLYNQELLTERERTHGEHYRQRILGHEERGAAIEGRIDNSAEGEAYRRIQRLKDAFNIFGSSARGLRDLNQGGGSRRR